MNNLQQRVISSLVMVIVFGLAVYVDHIGLLLTFGLMVLLTSMEYIAMVKPGNRMILPSLVAIIIYTLMYVLSLKVDLHYFLTILKLMCLFHLVILVELLLIKSKRALRSYFPGLIYLAMSASAIHYFQYYESYQVNLFILLALVWASDTGSYFVGKYLGSTPMASKISPNKTVEGFIGGLLLALAFSAVLIYFDVLDWRLWMVAGCMHVLVVLGDLIESKVKRLTVVKDSSHLIPGHGGFLDRCDGLLFALPFGILIYHYIFKV